MSNQSFREKVYAVAAQIPPGRVMTYGQIAALVGSHGAARAVGVCMKENPDQTRVPCHRVVSSTGKLIGYAFGGVMTKKEKLLREGVQFIDDRVNLAVSQL